MKHRRIAIIGLTLIMGALLLLPASPAHSAAAQAKVLLLFDSLAKGTPREGNVAELQRLLASYNAKVTLVSLDQYEQGGMAAYTNVITVINAPDLVIASKFYLEDLQHYQGRYLHIGYNPPPKLKQVLQLTVGTMYGGSADLAAGDFSEAGLQVRDMPYIAGSEGEKSYGSLSFRGSSLHVPYAVNSGSYTYAPYLEQGNFSSLAMADVLKRWLPAPGLTQTYLVIKEIYPFSDLNLLKETANRLYEAGIPFVASVRPVFSNTDYPAMQRYLEALKYVQSRNGSILVNAPVVMPSINSSDRTLREKMGGFINLLASGGIAPLGIGAEMYWTYDKEYAEAGMGFFDSAVLFPDERVIHMEQTHSSKAFDSSLYSMTPGFLERLRRSSKAMPDFPLNTAITVNLPEDESGLQEMLQDLDSYWMSFADYKQGDHRVTTEMNTIASSHGMVSINGQELNIDFIPKSVNSDFQYTEKQEESFTRLFSVQNQFFIVAIIVSLLFFGGLLIVGYRLYRRKYLK